MMAMRDKFVGKGGTWLSFAAVNDDNARAGAKAAFGETVRAEYNLDCDVIVSIDADPISMAPGSIANAIAFAQGRDVDSGKMSRLYVVESQFTTTGGAADHRLSVQSSNIPGFVASLAAAIDAPVAPTKDMPYRERVFAAMVSDLVAAKGREAMRPMIDDSRSMASSSELWAPS